MKQSPGFYAKICITCFVLSASDNYFSPSGFLGASGSALLLAGRRCQPASIVLRYLQDWKLWTTENKSGLWPKLTLQKTRLLTGAQCCEPVRLSQSRGVRSQCRRAVSVPPHNPARLFPIQEGLLPQQPQTWAGYVHMNRAESTTGKRWMQQRPYG